MFVLICNLDVSLNVAKWQQSKSHRRMFSLTSNGECYTGIKTPERLEAVKIFGIYRLKQINARIGWCNIDRCQSSTWDQRSTLRWNVWSDSSWLKHRYTYIYIYIYYHLCTIPVVCSDYCPHPRCREERRIHVTAFTNSYHLILLEDTISFTIVSTYRIWYN